MSIRDEIKKAGDTIPPGWKTAVQWAEEEGLSRCQTTSLIRRLIEEGKWEVQNFRVAYKAFTRPTPHYRPKP